MGRRLGLEWRSWRPIILRNCFASTTGPTKKVKCKCYDQNEQYHWQWYHNYVTHFQAHSFLHFCIFMKDTNCSVNSFQLYQHKYGKKYIYQHKHEIKKEIIACHFILGLYLHNFFFFFSYRGNRLLAIFM